jgi:hypothetical protein
MVSPQQGTIFIFRLRERSYHRNPIFIYIFHFHNESVPVLYLTYYVRYNKQHLLAGENFTLCHLNKDLHNNFFSVIETS